VAVTLVQKEGGLFGVPHPGCLGSSVACVRWISLYLLLLFGEGVCFHDRYGLCVLVDAGA